MTADTPREPVTEAGRKMLADLNYAPNSAGLDAILAIEAEARAAGLREAPQIASLRALVLWLNPMMYGDEAVRAIAWFRAEVVAAIDALAAPGAAPAEGRALDRVTLRDRVLALQPARKTLAYRQGYDDAVLAVLAMLRAPAEPDRIDVERLARAMKTALRMPDFVTGEDFVGVAAEYARLAAPAEPATEGERT